MLSFPVYFIITDANTLGEATDRYYPMGEVGFETVERLVDQVAAAER